MAGEALVSKSYFTHLHSHLNMNNNGVPMRNLSLRKDGLAQYN